MKSLKFFALVGIFSAVCYIKPAISGIEQRMLDQQPNYVVIGAFAFQKNAVKFTNHAQQQRLGARFEMNPIRNLYYVYVLSTDDRDQAISEARRLRNSTEFSDTWVYNGGLGKFVSAGQQRGIDINPMTDKKIERVQAEDKLVQSSDPSAIIGEEGSQATLIQPVNYSNEPNKETTVMAKRNEIDNGLEGKNFLFKIFRGVDNSTVEGDVDAIDMEHSKKMGTYKGNVPVKVTTPGSKSGKVSFVCEVFGYRKEQKDVEFSNPEGEGVTTDENSSVIVPFELVRLQKGDIAVMYNVYFFKDAGVMRPESRYEVNSLLEMLKENPKYKIKIHGHTNGGSPGKIISIGDSKNFFSLTGTKDGFGSAKKLSEERANVIREYLVSQGVDEKRMQIKAWGGKRPIHEKHSQRAQENVRVEIEILEN